MCVCVDMDMCESVHWVSEREEKRQRAENLMRLAG